MFKRKPTLTEPTYRRLTNPGVNAMGYEYHSVEVADKPAVSGMPAITPTMLAYMDMDSFSFTPIHVHEYVIICLANTDYVGFVMATDTDSMTVLVNTEPGMWMEYTYTRYNVLEMAIRGMTLLKAVYRKEKWVKVKYQYRVYKDSRRSKVA